MNWINAGSIWVAGMGGVRSRILRTSDEVVVAREIGGAVFTETQISRMLQSSSDDAITLFSGMTGTEGKGGTLFFATTEEYAASYSNNVQSFTISSSWYKQLLNEGLIETKVGVNSTTGALGAEVAVPNSTIQAEILKRINKK